MIALNKRVVIPVLIVLLGLGVLAYYLFFQGFSAQQLFERQTSRNLSDLRLINLKVDEVFNGAFSYIDYDQTVADLAVFEAVMKEIDERMAVLVGELDSATLSTRFAEIQKRFERKRRIVERFKAVNAVQNNSLRYLHELYQEFPLNAKGHPDEAAVRLEMGRFLASISLTNLREVGQGGWTSEQIALLKLPEGHRGEEMLTLFQLHARMVIEGGETLRRLIEENRLLEMDAQISRLSDEADRLFRERQARWMLIGNAAFAMGALFFVAFVLVFVREERLKKRLENINEELENRVAEETAKRHRQEQMLIQQSKLAAMGEMIGAIAHQWRQPLNTLAINIQDLEDARNFGELDEGYIKNMITRSMGLIKHMSQTINDFRNFFRQSKEKSRFDTYAAVRETLDLVRDQYRNHLITVLLTASNRPIASVDTRAFGIFEDQPNGEEHAIEGYLNEFKQAVLNILSNAKDAVIERREKLGDAQRPGIVLVSFAKENDEVVIKIEDNGGGVPDELLERIFEPYFSTKEEGKGTGIGLYMAKTILETNMGGTLSAGNGEEGAVFTLRFLAASPLSAPELSRP